MSSKASPWTPKRIHYLPPASHQLEDYRRLVCRRLGGDFAHPEVIAGFTQFVKVAVQIIKRHLNGGGFDNAADQG
ncbi:hypothetical protein HC928_03595 [bacterium]|nr:hypothetical protein [bacterium]